MKDVVPINPATFIEKASEISCGNARLARDEFLLSPDRNKVSGSYNLYIKKTYSASLRSMFTGANRNIHSGWWKPRSTCRTGSGCLKS